MSNGSQEHFRHETGRGRSLRNPPPGLRQKAGGTMTHSVVTRGDSKVTRGDDFLGHLLRKRKEFWNLLRLEALIATSDIKLRDPYMTLFEFIKDSLASLVATTTDRELDRTDLVSGPRFQGVADQFL
jgi:hypothetical protein